MAKKNTDVESNDVLCLACVHIQENVDENFEPKKGTNHGLCGAHAQQANKAINNSKGKLTWDILVAAGKARTSQRRSMSEWFEEAAE